MSQTPTTTTKMTANYTDFQIKLIEAIEKEGFEQVNSPIWKSTQLGVRINISNMESITDVISYFFEAGKSFKTDEFRQLLNIA